MAESSANPRRVLVVCTANACRSPVAERALQRAWNHTGTDVTVGSAGVTGGRVEVHPYTVEAARFTNIDLSDHRPRQFDRATLEREGTDLVIGMTRAHVRAVVELDRSWWPRTFTLRELARRTAALSEEPDTWEAWIAACHADRDPAALLLPDLIDDLPDPYGRQASDHILMVQEVTIHAGVIADAAR